MPPKLTRLANADRQGSKEIFRRLQDSPPSHLKLMESLLSSFGNAFSNLCRCCTFKPPGKVSLIGLASSQVAKLGNTMLP